MSGLLAPEPPELPEPALGESALVHDADFRALDATFGKVRDVVNLGIDALDDLGFGLRRLPEGSLEELLVLPLSGDHHRIRQNADAVRHVETALVQYAASTARLAVAADPRWGGDAAAAYLLRLGMHAGVARGCAEVVTVAIPVLGEVAEVAERTAVEVEELVVELVEKGRRLMARLLARVAGPLGWGVLAADVALHGIDAVTDLVDDARRLLAIIDRLTDMKGELATWVEEQRERLELLREVGDVARARLA
ncbi:hypothetical protein CFH99_20175 [Nocardioides aromaticivorans]|uniref:Uncharacterized protein n=1 Tax=Nocardioides aromaticivorans TaxID=200618 RepID=A0ABX7PQH2_9ACTN|nr:hypothetical protein [Nocardioides aromaticivorans]QSR27945.1 hypothetical protein CFH99_20175 [Nocardioides aromaticivorans]